MKQYTFDLEQYKAMPQVILGDRVLTINNRHSNMKKLQKVIEETKDQEEQLWAIFEVIVGKESMEYIKKLDLPDQAIVELSNLIVAAANGMDVEKFKEQQAKK
jgi:hypothetical protein